jgi:hypothetical protein
MPATVKELCEKRSALAESIGQYYKAVIANLDRTPWSHRGSEEKIPASQVAVPARVIRKITDQERRERERRESKEREDDERRRRMDPEVARYYEYPGADPDRVEVAWARESPKLTRVVLKGAPGGGKTFLAHTTALDLALEGQRQLESRTKELDSLPLPIMVELKKLEGDRLPRDLAPLAARWPGGKRRRGTPIRCWSNRPIGPKRLRRFRRGRTPARRIRQRSCRRGQAPDPARKPGWRRTPTPGSVPLAR